MQIVLNRKPIRHDILIKCIISIRGNTLILAFYRGVLFKSITVLETVLKYPPAKINDKLWV